MSVSELAFLKLFDEKVNGNSHYYLKVFHASKRRSYFTEEELCGLLGVSRSRAKGIISSLRRANALEKEGCLYKALGIREIAEAGGF